MKDNTVTHVEADVARAIAERAAEGIEIIAGAVDGDAKVFAAGVATGVAATVAGIQIAMAIVRETRKG